MSKKNKLVESITSRDEDFAQWYTDVCLEAGLTDYSSVKGCMILLPDGYAIWERIQEVLDKKFKETSHQNVAMPLFIPESLLAKEEEHVEGFAPEVAWVTHGGDKELEERLAIRPTSETLFCAYYAKAIQSYRDLPKLYNQWVSVVRWEMTTRPFLRTREFYWQEGHTAHADEKSAMEETLNILDVYTHLLEDYLAIPVIRGEKTPKEKFAGAERTFTIEAQMYDGKALQCGTTHYFGTGFAEAFGIQYSDENNELQYVHQSSWGVSTRLIGALIMVHSDDQGLVLPPKIAANQVIVVPVAQEKEGVLDKAYALKDKLSEDFSVLIDASEKSAGWKFSESELKGIPLRIEIGPRDIKNNVCVAVRRDTGEKIKLALDEDLNKNVQALLDDIQDNLFNTAKKRLDERIYDVTTYDEFKETAENKKGFMRAMWCGDQACEDAIKDETTVTSRCIPFDEEKIADTCIYCGKPAKHMVIWGKAY